MDVTLLAVGLLVALLVIAIGCSIAKGNTDTVSRSDYLEGLAIEQRLDRYIH